MSRACLPAAATSPRKIPAIVGNSRPNGEQTKEND
jgi:hypothetical protein